MKDFLIFRTDRLGDFIIHSRPISELKKKFPDCRITVVCSDLNKKIISKFSYIDNVIIFNKSDSLHIKFKTFIKIISINYFASFVLDGKNFSYLCNMFIRSKTKVGIIYKSTFSIFSFKLDRIKPSSIYNYFFFDKVELFTSKKSLKKEEHLPKIYINLFSDFISSDITVYSKYSFEAQDASNLLYSQIQTALKINDFIILHFDEKWVDLLSENNNLFNEIVNFQKYNNLRIIITSYNNNFDYYKVLKSNFDYHDCFALTDSNKLSKFDISNILILDNLEIFLFERFIKNSKANISCHSGFIAQVCGSNNGNIIDIINNEDEILYSCWKPKKTFHKFIYKSFNNKKVSLKNIFSNISKTLENL